MIHLDAQTAANAKVHLESGGGKTYAVVDVYNFDPAIKRTITDALPTEKPVFEYWDSNWYSSSGQPWVGLQSRTGYEPSLFRFETRYLGTTPDGWDHHQMRIELRDPEVLKQHLDQMGVMLSVPTSTYLGSRGVTASTNATIDTLFIG